MSDKVFILMSNSGDKGVINQDYLQNFLRVESLKSK
jgi:hypothetical protein